MNTERKVKVKSMVDYSVGISLPEIHFKRVFTKNGEIKTIPFEIMYEAVTSHGVRAMFDEGMLYIDNEQDRIDLGLQEEGSQPSFIPLTDLEVLRALKSDPIDKFEEIIKKQPKEQIMRIANIAIKNKILDYGKCELIKHYCGVDVIGAIQEENE